MLKSEFGINHGSMDLSVASGCPTTARLHIETMRFLADEYISRTTELSLGMALQT